MNEDGCGIGTWWNPGGAPGGPGDGVPTGPPAAYGLVTKEFSETIESIGSRSIGCLPARFDEGERFDESCVRGCPLPFRSDSGRGGTPRDLGSVDAMFVAVTGG